jgi:hypothetical protein
LQDKHADRGDGPSSIHIKGSENIQSCWALGGGGKEQLHLTLFAKLGEEEVEKLDTAEVYLSLFRSLHGSFSVSLTFSLSFSGVYLCIRMRACWFFGKEIFLVSISPPFILSFPVPSFSRADFPAKHVQLSDVLFQKNKSSYF